MANRNGTSISLDTALTNWVGSILDEQKKRIDGEAKREDFAKKISGQYVEESKRIIEKQINETFDAIREALPVLIESYLPGQIDKVKRTIPGVVESYVPGQTGSIYNAIKSELPNMINGFVKPLQKSLSNELSLIIREEVGKLTNRLKSDELPQAVEKEVSQEVDRQMMKPGEMKRIIHDEVANQMPIIPAPQVERVIEQIIERVPGEKIIVRDQTKVDELRKSVEEKLEIAKKEMLNSIDRKIYKALTTMDEKGSLRQVHIVPQPWPTMEHNQNKFLTNDGANVKWAAVDALPDQAGNSGKYLTTDGSDSSWGTVDLTGYVPYTGATADVTLGDNSLFSNLYIVATYICAGQDGAPGVVYVYAPTLGAGRLSIAMQDNGGYFLGIQNAAAFGQHTTLGIPDPHSASARFALSLSALTSTRVPYANANGILTDSASLTFDGQVLSVPGIKLTWNVVTGTTQALVVNTFYLINSALLCTCTLPSTAAIGSVIRIEGQGAGGWKVAQNAGQTINFGNQATTTGAGGSLASANQYDGVTLLCITADTGWKVIGALGNLTIA